MSVRARVCVKSTRRTPGLLKLFVVTSGVVLQLCVHLDTDGRLQSVPVAPSTDSGYVGLTRVQREQSTEPRTYESLTVQPTYENVPSTNSILDVDEQQYSSVQNKIHYGRR